jgi:hypothetical protein
MSEVYGVLSDYSLFETQLCSARCHIQPSTLLYHDLISTPFLRVFDRYVCRAANQCHLPGNGCVLFIGLHTNAACPCMCLVRIKQCNALRMAHNSRAVIGWYWFH